MALPNAQGSPDRQKCPYYDVQLNSVFKLGNLQKGMLWGVQPFGVSGPHWKKSWLGLNIKYTNTNEN